LAKKKIKTPGEKANDELVEFMNDIASRMAIIENYYWYMARDLSVTITALKAMKNILAKKKIVSAKQFDKEYEKLYKELIEIAEKAEKQQIEMSRGSKLSIEDVHNILNDPNIGHS
jgi:hypothetical protein